MKILFIAFCMATEVSFLHLASRSLYGMSIEYSGQTNGDSNTSDGRIKFVFLWSWLSRKSASNVPWVSVLVPTLMPIVLLSANLFKPGATPNVSPPRINCAAVANAFRSSVPYMCLYVLLS
jgi:hypothetical protein